MQIFRDSNRELFYFSTVMQNDYHRKTLSRPALEFFRTIPEHLRHKVMQEAQAIAYSHDLMNVTCADVKQALANLIK